MKTLATRRLNASLASKAGSMTISAFAIFFFTTTAIGLSAQTVTPVLSFNGTDGKSPISGLVQGFDGNLYGTSEFGGSNNAGTVFKISPKGILTTLHNFCAQPNCADGEYPDAALALGTDGSLYGTTVQGGTGVSSSGTVFRITPSGALTILYSFCIQTGCSDGAYPEAVLLLGIDGSFYGTTYEGGDHNFGTLFRITPKGQLTKLYIFCSKADCLDGEYPSYSGLVQAATGNFYGTTSLGGANGDYGTVFEVSPAGRLTTLYSFCSQLNCSDGIYPHGIVQGSNGNFYGTASAGGSCPYSTQGCGTVFSLTPAGKLTTLYTFCPANNCRDGAFPIGLTPGTDGNFYGTTSQGGLSKIGTFNGGSLFSITPAGIFTSLYGFCAQTNCSDGTLPRDLTQSTDGNFWGTTEGGGQSSSGCPQACGTIFTLGVGQGPFVETTPLAARAGTAISLLGNNLAGASSVTFSGIVATFSVVSVTKISVTVPAGAKTGKIKVITPHATLASKAAFRVTPQLSSFTPTSGPSGTTVTIVGDSFTQATRVTFDGVAAITFTINSDTEITAEVPQAAKTGRIAVTTAGGIASSSATFTVTP